MLILFNTKYSKFLNTKYLTNIILKKIKNMFYCAEKGLKFVSFLSFIYNHKRQLVETIQIDEGKKGYVGKN